MPGGLHLYVASSAADKASLVWRLHAIRNADHRTIAFCSYNYNANRAVLEVLFTREMVPLQKQVMSV